MNPEGRRNLGGEIRVFAGRYAYKRPLGRGAGGSVYLAEDLREKRREVALKVLAAEAGETVQGKMLRREFEILSKLRHPNLVRVYDYGILADGGLFLAEEYIDGFSLQDARALLEPEALIDLTIQVLQGLAYLHAMGMIHRDIKPANVMMLWLDDASARPMVKLVDFGLSSMDPKRDTLRGGTRSYMAPEVIRGEKGEQRSDLYSLGVTLYYALCGVLPFGPRTKDDPPPTDEDFRPPEPHRLNGAVPIELSRFTMALLRQVPDVDFADAGEALQALATDTGRLNQRAVGRMANSLDLAAPPVIQGYFERGILSRRIEEDDLLLEWLSMNSDAAMGQLYLIQGARGVGKSRLLQDVQVSAKLGGHLVLSLKGSGKYRPYGLLLEMARQLNEIVKGRGLRTLERYESAFYVRELLSELKVETPSESAAPMVEQAWMRSMIEDGIKALAPTPLIFFIDDLDQCDELSLEILADWYRSSRAKNRPDIVATTVEGDVFYELARSEGVQVLPITGVSVEDVTTFFTDQLHLKGLNPGWLADIAAASQGRPAYIEEICRYLIDSGMLRRESATRWKGRIADIEAAGVPASLRESLRRRVTAVGAAGRECLELLALLDRPVLWVDARALLCRGGSSPEEAERTLQTLEWRHLVRVDLTTGGRFLEVIHQDLAEAVVDMLSQEWRRALHRRIGELLLRRWQSGRGEALEAAEHLERGGRLQEAAPYFEIAGDRALDEGRFQEAASYFARALEGRRDVSARALLQLKLARSALAAYEPGLSREYLHRALERARSAGPDWLLEQALLVASRLTLAMGDIEGAEQYLEELRKECPTLRQSSESLWLEGQVALRQGNLVEAQKLFQRCEEACGPFATAAWKPLAIAARAHVACLLGKSDEVQNLYEDALESVDSRRHRDALGWILASYGADLRRLGSPMEAWEQLKGALPILAVAQMPDFFIEALFQLCWTLIDMGSSSTSRRRANEALCLAHMLGHPVLEHKIALLVGSFLLRRRGDQEASAARLAHLAETLERQESYLVDRAELLIAMGELMIDLQLTGYGPRCLQKGRQLAFQIGAQGLLPPVED